MHAKYYGWRYATFMAMLYVCMAAAGVTVHLLLAAPNLLPTARPSLGEMIHFKTDYTFWLNIPFAVLGGVLWMLHRQGRNQRDDGRSRREADSRTR